MKNKFYTSIVAFLFAFSLSAFSAKNIMNEINKKVSSYNNYTIEKEVITQSASAYKIIFLSHDKLDPLAVKVFTKLGSYKEEAKDIPKINATANTVKSYEKNNYNVPKLMQYKESLTIEIKNNKDENQILGIVIMEKARGNTLKYFIDDFVDVKTKDEISKTFNDIGLPFGVLTALTYQDNNHSILYHPDSNSENIFFDDKQNKIYWIDLGGIDLKPFNSNYIGGDILSFSKDLLKFSKSPDSPFKALSDANSSDDLNKYLFKVNKFIVSLQNRILAYNKIWEGFSEGIKSIDSLKIENLEKERSRFISTEMKSLQNSIYLAIKTLLSLPLTLTYASDEKIIELMNNLSLDVNHLYKRESIIMEAIRSNRSNIVNFLLNTKRANINYKNNHGQTPLDLAKSLNNKEIINLFTQQ